MINILLFQTQHHHHPHHLLEVSQQARGIMVLQEAPPLPQEAPPPTDLPATL